MNAVQWDALVSDIAAALERHDARDIEISLDDTGDDAADALLRAGAQFTTTVYSTGTAIDSASLAVGTCAIYAQRRSRPATAAEVRPRGEVNDAE